MKLRDEGRTGLHNTKWEQTLDLLITLLILLGKSMVKMHTAVFSAGKKEFRSSNKSPEKFHAVIQKTQVCCGTTNSFSERGLSDKQNHRDNEPSVRRRRAGLASSLVPCGYYCYSCIWDT